MAYGPVRETVPDDPAHARVRQFGQRQKGGETMEKKKRGYEVTNAGAQVVQPVHPQAGGAANQVVRGNDLRNGRSRKK